MIELSPATASEGILMRKSTYTIQKLKEGRRKSPIDQEKGGIEELGLTKT